MQVRGHETEDATSVDTVTVVVLNWNGADLTLRCVDALVGDGVPPERIIVVDNGSRDDSVARLQRELPDGARLVEVPDNVGYARAANLGAASLPGTAYLVSNNDAFAHEQGSVARLLGAFADASVGLAVPRLLNPDLTLQKTVRPLQRPGISLLKATGLGKFVPNRWQPRFSHHWDHSSSREIDAADGAVVAVRGETWRQLGGYNELRRMYGEDSDLCWRTRSLGWRIRYEAGAEFVHLGNATGSKTWSSPERARMVGREESKLLYEQLGPVRARVAILGITLYLTRRRVLHRLKRDDGAVAALRAERAEYWRRLWHPAGGPP